MRRVLIVDDSPTVRNLLAETLRHHGWQVDCAEDGTEAAAQALSQPPDAVVSDLWMPGLSGLQLCRLLHEDPVTAHVPVVLLSASSLRRSRFWAARSGASAFVDKSRIAEVPALLERLADSAPGAAAAVPGRRVDPGTIPARLSRLLDGALFESVLASEVRGLALSNVDLPALFRGLAALLVEIVHYRWMALGAQSTAGANALYVQAHPDDLTASEAAARAVGMTGARPELLVADPRCGVGRVASVAVVSRRVEHAGVLVGVVTMAVEGPTARVDDAHVLDVAARELSLPLRLVALLEQTQRDATTDGLTGLLNRRAASDALERVVATADRHAHPVAVVILDLDHFKKVNDSHGHPAGDAVLRHVAGVLRRVCRKQDIIGRWGGEEFLLILPHTNATGARIAAERVRIAIAAEPVSVDDGVRIDVTASLGVASRVEEGVDALVERADRALYDAKRRGRNRVEMAPVRSVPAPPNVDEPGLDEGGG